MVAGVCLAGGADGSLVPALCLSLPFVKSWSVSSHGPAKMLLENLLFLLLVTLDFLYLVQ